MSQSYSHLLNGLDTIVSLGDFTTTLRCVDIDRLVAGLSFQFYADPACDVNMIFQHDSLIIKLLKVLPPSCNYQLCIGWAGDWRC